MKVKVKYIPTNTKVLVYHFTGKKAVDDMLQKINARIKTINNDLRGLYE